MSNQIFACGSLTFTNTYRPLVSHLRILWLSVSHSQRPPLPRLYPGWQYLTFRLKLVDLPYANRDTNARTDEANVLKSLSCSLHCNGKCYSCPGLLLATTLTCDIGCPNSSCNCDCGASLVETETFPGGKGGTLKWRLCPISLSTT